MTTGPAPKELDAVPDVPPSFFLQPALAKTQSASAEISVRRPKRMIVEPRAGFYRCRPSRLGDATIAAHIPGRLTFARAELLAGAQDLQVPLHHFTHALGRFGGSDELDANLLVALCQN